MYISTLHPSAQCIQKPQFLPPSLPASLSPSLLSLGPLLLSHLVLTSSSLTRLQLIQIPPTNRQVPLVLIHTLPEIPHFARTHLRSLVGGVLDVLALVVLRERLVRGGRRGLVRAGAATEEAADGVADRGPDHGAAVMGVSAIRAPVHRELCGGGFRVLEGSGSGDMGSTYAAVLAIVPNRPGPLLVCTGACAGGAAPCGGWAAVEAWRDLGGACGEGAAARVGGAAVGRLGAAVGPRDWRGILDVLVGGGEGCRCDADGRGDGGGGCCRRRDSKVVCTATPELKSTPLVVGADWPEGCLGKRPQAAALTLTPDIPHALDLMYRLWCVASPCRA